MKYTNWDNNKLLKLYNELMENAKTNDDPLIMNDIYLLRQILKDEIYLFQLPLSFIEKIETDINTMINFDDFNDHIIEFSHKKNYLPQLKVTELSKYKKLNFSTVLGFTHDFYNSIDHEIASLFNRSYRQRYGNVRFSSKRSTSIYLPYSEENFISIRREKTIADFFESIHEFGHSVQERLCYRDSYFNYPFVELAPIFFSILAYDKMIESFEDIEEEVNIYQVVEAKTILNYANMIDNFVNYFSLNELIPSKKKTVRDMSNKLNKSHHFIKDLLSVSNVERYAYIIPYLVSIELYYLYQKDAELALHRLKELINLPQQENYLVSLLDRDIILNEHSTDYIKSLKK